MTTRSHVLDSTDRVFLAGLVQEHGLSGASRKLDISRGVISSAAAGISIRKGSLDLIKAALAAERGRK